MKYSEGVNLTLLKPEIISLLRAEIAGLQLVYFFGSQERGLATPESDLDIGVVATRKLHGDVLYRVGEKIAGLVKRDVDLVDVANSSDVFAAKVIESGSCVFSVSEDARVVFESLVCSRYVRLNEARKGILHDLLHRPFGASRDG